LLRYDVRAVLARMTCSTALATALLLTAGSTLQRAVADGDTRTLSFRHAHTGEEITITYKRNGRYDDAALKRLNWFMRDWRKDEQVEMNPQLFDLVWETNRAVGGTQTIEVICGYRSPGTNAMLRARSNGVAENSNHTRGEALDFFIPGVPLEKIREAGLRFQRGGVGFYPTSGSPFVHLDTGSIRHWPRMSPDQLARVFPDGRTVHIPTNGQPLSGYALALADVERQGRHPSSLSLAAARNSGAIDADEDRETTQQAPRNLIADLLGMNKDKIEPVTQPPAPTMASLKPKPAVAMAAVPMPKQRPVEAIEVAAYVPMPTARPVMHEIEVAAYVPTPNARPNAAKAADMVVMAVAEPLITASAGPVMAYAPEMPGQVFPATTARPMGAKMPKVVTAAVAPQPAKSDAAIVAAADTSANSGALGDNPWLRAMVLTPNATTALTASATGKYETQAFGELMKKPASTVVMSFASAPYAELATDRFSGKAVVFVSTMSFGTRTAALR
jgi:uncharacterized protein YcbK (DUF882 family)